jgi:hypothetical protein
MRLKTIPQKYLEQIPLNDFENLLSDKPVVKKIEGVHKMIRAYKKSDEPAVKSVIQEIEIGKERWSGRRWDKETNRWLPLVEDGEEGGRASKMMTKKTKKKTMKIFY